MFRVFGIQLAVHASFALLLAYAGYEGWNEGGWPGMIWSIGLVLAFFVCVVLHELGHSLTARRYGVQVPRILLMPIGGMAEFDRIPRKPAAELVITLAGPAVNFAIVAVLAPIFWRDLFGEQPAPMFGGLNLGLNLLVANAIMGTFNLLPVFPMDGGRIFRALLAMRLPYLKATQIAAMTGKVLSPILAVVALFVWHWYMLAALFLFIFAIADAEYKQLKRRELEAQYWADFHRRMAVALNAPPSDNPPAIHGPN